MKVRGSRKKTKKLKIFFLFIFLFSLLLSGVIIADKNTRAIGFGDNSPIFEINEHENQKWEVEINVIGKNFKKDVTDIKSMIDALKNISGL